MKTQTQATVTVDADTVRKIAAAAMAAGVGAGDHADVRFDIGERDDGYGFHETGTTTLRSASLVIRSAPCERAGLVVAHETTVTMDETELRHAVAEHVASTLDATVSPDDVRLHLTPRHQGDAGYEGPYLEKAVVAVKNI